MNKGNGLVKTNKYILLLVTLLGIILFTFHGITQAVFQNTSVEKDDSKAKYNKEDPSLYKTFTSPDLGISFQYQTGAVDTPVNVKQIGNKIYLYVNYTSQDNPTKGKYVEVLTKDSNESLTDAIKKQFLQNYSLEDCPIVTANLDKRTIDKSNEYLQITIPGALNSSTSMKEIQTEAKRCPSPYTYDAHTGIVYFMADPKHPDKFAFFKLGQDNFRGEPIRPNGTAKSWDMTLKFLP